MDGGCTFWNSRSSKIPHKGLESMSLLVVPENVSEKLQNAWEVFFSDHIHPQKKSARRCYP